MSPQDEFQIALLHHKSGRFAEAEKQYRKVLDRQPNNFEALHLLGVIHCQAGERARGAEYIRQSLAINPRQANALINLGMALNGDGKLDEAINAFSKAIAIVPGAVEAHYHCALAHHAKGQLDQTIESLQRAVSAGPNRAEIWSDLGNAFVERGRYGDAIEACRRAVAIRPTFAEAWSNLGAALTRNGQHEESAAACRRAISLKPDFAEAQGNLGVALNDLGQHNEALAVLRKAIALRPASAKSHTNLASVLTEVGRTGEAVDACRTALSLRPDYPEAQSTMGNALQQAGQVDEAVAAHRRAIAADPGYANAHCNLGVSMLDSGRIDEAIAAYRTAIDLDPAHASSHCNLGIALLLKGELTEGWSQYEWRWKTKSLRLVHPNFTQPKWDGSNLAGRTLLLHAEQGYGDAIQFIRYVPEVAKRGGRIIVTCQQVLHRLLRGVAGIEQLLTPQDALPPFDVHCALLGLPAVFGTTLASIPQTVPYLQADPSQVQRWRERFESSIPRRPHAATRFNVGLAWAGNPAHKNDRNRSITLAQLSPLADVPGVSFFSLQKGERAIDGKGGLGAMQVNDWTDDIHDFADTAAMVSNLDLVISVDTSVVHLAGALRKPAWTLLPHVPDWRWLMKGEQSPWYPTMRLFRQPALSDWDRVIDNVKESLGIAVQAVQDGHVSDRPRLSA